MTDYNSGYSLHNDFYDPITSIGKRRCLRTISGEDQNDPVFATSSKSKSTFPGSSTAWGSCYDEPFSLNALQKMDSLTFIVQSSALANIRCSYAYDVLKIRLLEDKVPQGQYEKFSDIFTNR